MIEVSQVNFQLIVMRVSVHRRGYVEEIRLSAPPLR